eukprot:4872191-Prymnesium_polylepis.1
MSTGPSAAMIAAGERDVLVEQSRQQRRAARRRRRFRPTSVTTGRAYCSRAGRRASARPAAASCETSTERARKGMRPEAGARYADS